MSNNRGIFDNFPKQAETPPAKQSNSPFAVAAAEEAKQSAPAQAKSPFSVISEAPPQKQPESGSSAAIPETRKPQSPFQVADAPEGFGFEAPSPAPAVKNPFESMPPTSPFATAPEEPAPPTSPFTAEPATPATPAPASPQAAIAAFKDWNEPDTSVPEAPKSEPKPQPTPQPTQQPAAAPQAPSAFEQPKPPAPQKPAEPAAAEAPAAFDDLTSDSASIRQLELRAIFGVDREMNSEEILQRSRALPGMKNIARVSQKDMATIEALKSFLPNLGFGNGSLKLYSGSVPLEFIREKSVMLAVQTDGGFAPGVRETLMIVARELDRLGGK